MFPTPSPSDPGVLDGLMKLFREYTVPVAVGALAGGPTGAAIGAGATYLSGEDSPLPYKPRQDLRDALMATGGLAPSATPGAAPGRSVGALLADTRGGFDPTEFYTTQIPKLARNMVAKFRLSKDIAEDFTQEAGVHVFDLVDKGHGKGVENPEAFFTTAVQNFLQSKAVAEAKRLGRETTLEYTTPEGEVGAIEAAAKPGGGGEVLGASDTGRLLREQVGGEAAARQYTPLQEAQQEIQQRLLKYVPDSYRKVEAPSPKKEYQVRQFKVARRYTEGLSKEDILSQVPGSTLSDIKRVAEDFVGIPRLSPSNYYELSGKQPSDIASAITEVTKDLPESNPLRNPRMLRAAEEYFINGKPSSFVKRVAGREDALKHLKILDLKMRDFFGK